MIQDHIQKIVIEKLENLQTLSLLAEVESYLNSSSHFYIVGGFVRDAARMAIENYSYQPYDIDVVVETQEELHPAVEKVGGGSYKKLALAGCTGILKVVLSK